jgi:RNA polymerase sigma factor (sigma-70 family)
MESASQKMTANADLEPFEVLMGRPPSEHTNVSLLGRVGQNPVDEGAWGAFVEYYGPKIQGWCRKRGLQAADADDVTQDVLLRLSRALRTFVYDPSRSFRGWLRLVTEHALSDFFAHRNQRPSAGSSDELGLAVLDTVCARDDLLEFLNEEFTRVMVSQACEHVRARVEPQTWEAFRLTACENLPGDEVAASLGMNVATVHKAKSRVLAFIREEVKRLDGEA